jgi:NhaA family Na+:H+ antiporter
VRKRYWPDFIERFCQVEAASGVVLLLAAFTAFAWANSPWKAAYHDLSRPLHSWVNDGLMGLFFVLVGLEVRRERREGALADLKVAMLPVAAAIGGVLIPALLYVCLNAHAETLMGWAVPTATDIAFALGVLALLGARVTPALRVLLLTIAIVDDVVAIVVITLFYSTSTDLGGAVGISVVILAHPTLAGFIAGLCIPAPIATRVERILHPWVAFGVMPVFALANAGVSLDGLQVHSLTATPVALGILVGFVLGKPIGIILTISACTTLRWCSLPRGVDLRGLIVIACLAGIGFTMALFICDRAFADDLLSAAKLAILVSSVLASLIGVALGRALLPVQRHDS